MIANLFEHLRIKYFCVFVKKCSAKCTVFAHVREPFFTLLLQLMGLSLFGMSAGVIFSKLTVSLLLPAMLFLSS